MLNLPPVRPQGHPALSMQYPEAFTGVKAKFPMPSTIDDICRELRLLQKTIQFVYAILVRGIYLLIQFIKLYHRFLCFNMFTTIWVYYFGYIISPLFCDLWI